MFGTSASNKQNTSVSNSDGSFNYWDDGHYDAWADIYAGYFLIEAQSLNVITKSEILKSGWTKVIQLPKNGL